MPTYSDQFVTIYCSRINLPYIVLPSPPNPTNNTLHYIHIIPDQFPNINSLLQIPLKLLLTHFQHSQFPYITLQHIHNLITSSQSKCPLSTTTLSRCYFLHFLYVFLHTVTLLYNPTMTNIVFNTTLSIFHLHLLLTSLAYNQHPNNSKHLFFTILIQSTQQLLTIKCNSLILHYLTILNLLNQ